MHDNHILRRPQVPPLRLRFGRRSGGACTRRTALVVVGLALGAHVPVRAEETTAGTQDSQSVPTAVELMLNQASYRLGSTVRSDIRVDSNGDTQANAQDSLYRQRHRVDHVLRVGPELILGSHAAVHSDVQLSAGFLTLDAALARYRGLGLPRDESGAAFGSDQSWLDQFQVRKLYLDLTVPFGIVRIGRMASAWGLGLLANSGDDELIDWGEPELGQDRNVGDVIDRALVATAPLTLVTGEAWARRLALALGADVVVRDEHVVLGEGDRAYEGVGALRYAAEGDDAGLYVAYRTQRDRDREWIKVWAYDLYGRTRWRGESLEFTAAGEVVALMGRTSLGRTSAIPTANIKVQQLGYVARGGATWLPWGAGADVELGYASGDSNPYDRFSRGFSFDPNYHPSLILFEELVAVETVVSAANASNPALVAEAPGGVRRYGPTNGALTNAIYLRPTVRYERGSPDSKLGARVAVLWARAPENIVDPYGTTLAASDGRPHNYQGGRSSARDLGVELDVGADYHTIIVRELALDLGMQLGRLWPGEAFANGAGKRARPINAAFARALVRWHSPAQTGD